MDSSPPSVLSILIIQEPCFQVLLSFEMGSKEYLKQGVSHCGAYSVKGVLGAVGLDKTHHPKEYHLNWFCRLTGLTLNKQY
ncbi:hypothetical protein CO051_01835 [Candidatus Roizmanbacteria bacterium CG_4_9_14_0_2_um_filter_39_13]|uniref:Uncharacterized protein n=1 Tax=Candidatus Roizmanbacteria bacterium CG_4_9_14_0_2_um_filter_39_13 TaxID=1974839 RepID=A0A2M8F1U9_9BACT|nr:MAG: hypothetical protein CO051_01835 [Candidatus Roizmanbacteria bacterium CG_4_9_14_0_2_um_filter_39_13]